MGILGVALASAACVECGIAAPVAVIVGSTLGTVAAALGALVGVGWTGRRLLEHPGKDHLALRVGVAVMLLGCAAFGCVFLLVEGMEWAAAPAVLFGIATALGAKEVTQRINADVGLSAEERTARLEKAGPLSDKAVAFLLAGLALLAFVSRI